jgi:hypothetical protein
MAAGDPWEVLINSLQAGITLEVGPTVLQQLQVNNLDAAAVYVQLHDINAVQPAPGAVPLINFRVGANSTLFWTPPNPNAGGAVVGQRFADGVFVGASSTPDTWTSTGVGQLQIYGWGRDTE